MIHTNVKRDELVFSKNTIELVNYGKVWDNVFIMPTLIAADKTTCRVHFSVIDESNIRKTVIQEGIWHKHQHHRFFTEIHGIKFNLDLKNNVMKLTDPEMREYMDYMARWNGTPPPLQYEEWITDPWDAARRNKEETDYFDPL